jgi:hypothetical protein
MTVEARLLHGDYKFDFIHTDGAFGYYSCKWKRSDGEEREACLEPCLNGYDAAIYDGRQGILRPKVCTNLTGEALINALELATVTAARFIEEDFNDIDYSETWWEKHH